MTFLETVKSQLEQKQVIFTFHFTISPSFLSFPSLRAILSRPIAGVPGDYLQFRQDQVSSLIPLIHLQAFLFIFSLYFMSFGSLEIPRASNMINTTLSNRGRHWSRYQRPGMPSRGALARCFCLPGSVGRKK